MLRKVLATVVVASIAALGIAVPQYEGNKLSVRQNHGDYEDIWHQPLPPVMKGEVSPPPPQGTAVPNSSKGPRCFCPNGQAGVFTNGKCECPPLPAGRPAYIPLSNESEEKPDAPAEDTEALDGQQDFEERGILNIVCPVNCPWPVHQNGKCFCVPPGSNGKRDTAESTIPDEQPHRPAAPKVNCAFKIECGYMQHAVRQNGVCACVPLHNKEKRDTAESTIPDEQPYRPAAPKVNCAFKINCAYTQHAVRQNGVCTCVPLGSKEKRSTAASSQHEQRNRHAATNNCDWMKCSKGEKLVQQQGKCTCVLSQSQKKRDISKEMTESTAERALEERKVNCAFKINCDYMQHAVRQHGVCTCVPSPSKEKRGTATLDDFDHEGENGSIPGHDMGNDSSD